MRGAALARLLADEALGLAPPRMFVDAATQALVGGLDSPTLRVLAGEDGESLTGWDAGVLLGRVVDEVGLVRPTAIQAAWYRARVYGTCIVNGSVSPIEGARAMERTADALFPGRLGDLDPFVFAVSEWGGPADELVRLDRSIRAQAQELVDRAPSPWFLSWCRITRYDPANRDERGRYRPHTWTHISDIGRSFDGERLTADTYERVESAYVAAALTFATKAGPDSLEVSSLLLTRRYAGPPIDEGTALDLARAGPVLRQLLRGDASCELAAPDDSIVIHVVDDLYMWVGTPVRSREAVDASRRLGLFVDVDFPSPFSYFEPDA